MPHTTAQIIIPDDFPPVISRTPVLQTMQAHGHVTVYTSRPETQDEFVTRIREAHTVVNIRAYCKFIAEVLQACPHVQHLAIWSTGTDNVDLAAAQAAGSVVTNTPNTATDALAEQGLALLQEPIASDDLLLTLPNVVLSPHTAGTTPEALMNGLNLCVANVVAFLQGQVQHRVV